jgi:hypothetical protein
MHKLTLPAIPEIRARQPQAKDSFLLCNVSDMPELIRKHCLGHYREAALRALAGKNIDLTKLAEKYIHRFEEDVFTGLGWQVRDSVVGAVPNVPAMLAGVPCDMRQRYRTNKNNSPLTLYLELTGSSGVTGEPFVERGAAILALARLLSNTRPVEIWTTTTYGTTGILNMVACKLETTPLDVARGAAMLCDHSLRATGYDVNQATLGSFTRHAGACNGWAYGVPDLERKWAGEILARVLNPGSTMVYIPAAYLGDSLSDPAQWIRTMLAKYGPTAEVDESW